MSRRLPADGVGVGVGAGVGVGVGAGVGVGVGLATGLEVAVGVGLTTGVGDGVVTGVGLGAGVEVAVGVGLTTGVGDGVVSGVGLDEGVAGGVAVGRGVGVGLGDGVAVGVGLGVASAATMITVALAISPPAILRLPATRTAETTWLLPGSACGTGKVARKPPPPLTSIAGIPSAIPSQASWTVSWRPNPVPRTTSLSPTPTGDGLAVIAGPPAAAAGIQAMIRAGTSSRIGSVARFVVSRLGVTLGRVDALAGIRSAGWAIRMFRTIVSASRGYLGSPARASAKDQAGGSGRDSWNSDIGSSAACSQARSFAAPPHDGCAFSCAACSSWPAAVAGRWRMAPNRAADNPYDGLAAGRPGLTATHQSP